LNRLGDPNRLKLALHEVHPKKISKTLTIGGAIPHATRSAAIKPRMSLVLHEQVQKEILAARVAIIREPVQTVGRPPL
jgi:hypothetical protein